MSAPDAGPKLKSSDRFSQVFNVLLNYWEIKPIQYETKLHELALKNVRTVSSFVPWGHVETDIFHSLKKFVRAAASVRLRVRLFVMPELGVNYPNSGIPRDLLLNTANLAVDHDGQIIYNAAAPNVFPLPSFSSPEVLRRFGNYVMKLGTILGEIFAETGNSDFCEIVVSNTLFNYYRASVLSPGEHGDFSAAQVMAFRDFLDREYRPIPSAAAASGETAAEPAAAASEPGPSIAPATDPTGEQFKMQLYESCNRHRFLTHVEKLLREKTEMVFSRKATACEVRHVDLLNPECAPELSYQSLLAEVFDFKPSVERYYRTIVSSGHRNELIFLGDSGAFRRFSDQEKSFLLLTALVHSGEVCAMVDDFFRLSPGFHRKLKNLIQLLDERKLIPQKRVSYISGSKFSMEDSTFDMLSRMAPGVLSVHAGMEPHPRSFSERLVFVDPKSIVRLVEFVQMLSAAQTGKVVAIPAPMSLVPNYVADALGYLEKFKKGRHCLKLNIGIPYEVYEYHLGHVVFYDPQMFWAGGERQGLALFIQAMLGLADTHANCTVSDPRIQVPAYVSEEDPSNRLLFVINPTADPIDVTLGFREAVSLSPLPESGYTDELAQPIAGSRFELTVPALGILSMQLSDATFDQVNALPQDRPVRMRSPAEHAGGEVSSWT